MRENLFKLIFIKAFTLKITLIAAFVLIIMSTIQSVIRLFIKIRRKLQVQVGHSHSRNLVPNPSVTVGAAGFYRERGCRNRQVA